MADIQAVLFDFGKVLTRDPNPAAWARMLQFTGLPEALMTERYWGARDAYDEGLLTGNAYWQQIAGEPLDEATLRSLKAADLDLWTDMNEPMLQWVHQLHAADVRTGILSNMPDAMAQGICERFDWIGNFDHTTWSHALKTRKPRADIYTHAIRGLQTSPENILFLDDKEENIAAARDAGMQAIQYRDHNDFVREMNRRGFGHLLSPSKAAATAL